MEKIRLQGSLPNRVVVLPLNTSNWDWIAHCDPKQNSFANRSRADTEENMEVPIKRLQCSSKTSLWITC